MYVILAKVSRLPYDGALVAAAHAGPLAHLEAFRMPLPRWTFPPLVRARFLERPNRFLLRCARPGSRGTLLAHCPDPGRLEELLRPGRTVYLRAAPAEGRRTRWSAVLVQTPSGEGLVGLDTLMANRLVGRGLAARALREVGAFAYRRAEFVHGRSRFDFLLEDQDGGRMALEVKSVSLVENGVALFPDAVTARGVRHLRELTALARRRGWRAGVLFVVQRSDARRVRAAAHIDPAFAAALADARAAGVALHARRCRVTTEEIRLDRAVPVD